MLKLDKLDSMEIIRIGVKDINHGKRLRAKNEETIKRLAGSFEEVGQLSPIIVRKVSDAADKYNLVAGLHRLYAAKKLKWDFIQGVILAEGSDVELESQEVEIRENLDRGELTLQERAVNVQALEEVLKKKHAKKRGSAPGKAGGGKKAKSVQVGRENSEAEDKIGATIKAVAEETGMSPAAVKRDVNRAASIPRILETEGTSLGSGVELDALAGLPEAVQSELIDKAVAGEHVSARDVLNAPAKIEPIQQSAPANESKKPTQKDIDHEEAVNATWDWCEAMQAAGIPLATVITWCEAILKTRNPKKYLEGMMTEMHNRLQRKAAAE